jgi:hypothetical protein
MALPDYNRQFLEISTQGGAISNNAAKYGVEVKPMTAPANATHYWRIVGVHHLTGSENRGNHHVYCDILDEEGRRINGSRLRLTQDGAAPVFAVVDKPANEAGTNFPLWSSNLANVTVQWPGDNPLPSEEVRGIRTTHPDEEIGNTWGHHSFYIVFQRTAIKPPEGGGASQPTPTTSTPTTPTQIPSSGGGATTPSALEETIIQVGQPKIIPLNRKTVFHRTARQQKLGQRLTTEYDVEYQGKKYRAQIFEKGIVYAEVGDWGNIKVIPRQS